MTTNGQRYVQNGFQEKKNQQQQPKTRNTENDEYELTAYKANMDKTKMAVLKVDYIKQWQQESEVLTYKVKMQYVHFRLRTNYFLLPWDS